MEIIMGTKITLVEEGYKVLITTPELTAVLQVSCLPTDENPCGDDPDAKYRQQQIIRAIADNGGNLWKGVQAHAQKRGWEAGEFIIIPQ
jgi:hypothetical protein